MLIDSHAHLDYEYEKPTAELLELARAAGVDRVVAIAAAADSLDRVRVISETFPNVYFSSGIHPHDSKDFSPEIFSRIRELAQHPRCVAIGELGLDYFYELSDKQLQFDALKTQLDFSVEIGKPVVVHTREADEDTVRFLTPHAEAYQARHPGRAPGVIHCFTGSADLARACLKLGYHISFSGIITFKTAGDLREVVKDIVPLDRIMVETDSPFLAPVPHRGKKNMPAHTRVVAEMVASLKGISLEELAKIATENTERLFGIPKA